VKDLYNEIYKTLKKETEEDTRQWNELPCSWISQINVVKTAVLLKAIYRFSVLSIKFPFFIEKF
jgi:hypothetical protein